MDLGSEWPVKLLLTKSFHVGLLCLSPSYALSNDGGSYMHGVALQFAPVGPFTGDLDRVATLHGWEERDLSARPFRFHSYLSRRSDAHS
jgi:hypothetical protein